MSLSRARRAVVHQTLGIAADGDQLGARAHAVGTHLDAARIHLRGQARHAHHVELVEVRSHDGQKLHPLEERVPFVLRLFQDAALEGQEAQFPVQVQLGILEIDLLRLRRCSSRLHGAYLF